jgi:hypothetical protein
MYEMEGALLGLAAPADQLPGFSGAARRPPGPDTRVKHRFPGPSHVPRVAPEVVPVSDGETISSGCEAAAQEFPPKLLERFSFHTVSTGKKVVIRT